MARQFDVVGHGDMEDVVGEIMGEVMGRLQHHGGHHGGARHLKLPPKPDWRGQLAPGVIQPDEGMVPLPLAPSANGGTFSATVPTITFQGQLQKPFRGERILVSVVRTGATSTGRLLSQFFVGTDLQQADITQWDLELVGQANAFGTRLTMKAAEPGVLIRALVTPNVALTGTDTIFASVLLLGRIVH